MLAAWEGVPIIQKWQFSLVNDKEMVINIQFASPVELEIEDLFFIFSIGPYYTIGPHYREWETAEKKGRLSAKNIFWDTNINLAESTKWLTLSNRGESILPSVTFIPASGRFKITPIINYQRSPRKVKVIISEYGHNKFLLTPGEYDFLSLKLLLNQDHSEILKHLYDKN